MKVSAPNLLICLLCCYGLSVRAVTTDTLAEAQAKAEALRPEECVRVCIDLAQRELNDAKFQFIQGDSEKAKVTLQSVAAHAEKATDGGILGRKREKQLEIELRQISHRLGDLKRTLPYEDQASAQAVMDEMEKLRTRLLESMFPKGKK